MDVYQLIGLVAALVTIAAPLMRIAENITKTVRRRPKTIIANARVADATCRDSLSPPESNIFSTEKFLELRRVDSRIPSLRDISSTTGIKTEEISCIERGSITPSQEQRRQLMNYFSASKT